MDVRIKANMAGETLYLELLENPDHVKEGLFDVETQPPKDLVDKLQDTKEPPMSLVDDFTPPLSPVEPPPPPQTGLHSALMAILDEEEKDDTSTIASIESRRSRSSKYATPARNINPIVETVRQVEVKEEPVAPPPLSSIISDQPVRSREDEVFDETTRKRELLYRINRLRQQEPDIELPMFTMQSDLNVMEAVYEDELRRVAIDSSVERYQKILQVGLMLTELIMGKVFKLPIDGFARHEMITANTSYNKLLAELGEKHHKIAKSQFPVELRLCAMIVFNAALYAGIRVFTGSMMPTPTRSSENTPTPAPVQPQPSNAPRKTMRGPKIPKAFTRPA